VVPIVPSARRGVLSQTSNPGPSGGPADVVLLQHADPAAQIFALRKLEELPGALAHQYRRVGIAPKMNWHRRPAAFTSGSGGRIAQQERARLYSAKTPRKPIVRAVGSSAHDRRSDVRAPGGGPSEDASRAARSAQARRAAD